MSNGSTDARGVGDAGNADQAPGTSDEPGVPREDAVPKDPAVSRATGGQESSSRTDAAPAQAPGAIPGWGQQAASQPAAAPKSPSAESGAIPGWGQQAASAPQAAPPQPAMPPSSGGSGAIPGWGQQVPPPPPAAPTWGTPGSPVTPTASTGPSPAAGWASQPPPAGPGGPVPGGQPAWDAGAQVARSSGCLRFGLGVLIALFVLLIVLVAVIVIVVSSLLGKFGADVTNTGANGGVDAPCPYLSSDDARQVVGGDATANELTGLAQATIGIVLDTRVLPNDRSCWVSGGQKAYIARVAVHQGSDAASVFADERTKAQPTSQDQGNGLSLENSGYFAGDVSGLGDEAFCTGLSPAIMAGVLVHQGDRDVYVSVGSADQTSGPPDIGTTDSGVVTAPGMCSLAQDLARKVLK